MRPLPAGLALALLLAPLGSARADFLYSRAVGGGPGGVPDILTSVRVRLVITPDPYDDFLSPFLALALTPADVGKTFTADAASPHFAASAAWLTDGLDGRVFFAVGAGADGWYEKGFFYNAPHGPSVAGPFDLKGATLSQVKLLVTDLQLTSPGKDLGRDGVWTDYLFKGVVTLKG